MKNSDLQKLLSKLPPSMEVAILDVRKNERLSSDEPCSAGIYPEFNINKMMSDAELLELRTENPLAQNFIALEFDSDEEGED